MKLDEKTLRSPVVPCGTSDPSESMISWISRHLTGDGEKFLASAPGRLDVLGGFIDYSGGLVVSVPLAETTSVGAQTRADGLIMVTQRHHGAEPDGAYSCQIPLAQFQTGSGGWISGRAAGELLRSWSEAIRCCLGTVIETLRKGLLAGFRGGLTLALGTDLERLASAGRIAAVSAAALTAVTGATHTTVTPHDAIAICTTVENEWLGVPAGPADAMCALLGEPAGLTQCRCDNVSLGGVFRLPVGLRLTALDCGQSSDGHDERFEQVRTAVFMGRFLIDRIVRHDGFLSEQWDGHLSRISVNDFVERVRDRLPTRMMGREFLDRFGETGDPLTRVTPNHAYRVRSRTEHHVYEHARSRQFIEAISRGARRADRAAFVEAGKAMHASHWSYGQRCGMGSPTANGLVAALKKTEPVAGIFGARVCGRGCGGMVAILSEDTHTARQAIEDTLAAFRHEHHVEARILTGSSPGALIAGVQRI